jgi:hypothetical protein
MISAWHLLWIVPLCCSSGCFAAALLFAGKVRAPIPDTDTVKRHLFEEVHKGMRGGL